MEVGEKTYYGCCQGCKARRQQDESIRQAVDPLTGEEVDKATAVAVAHVREVTIPNHDFRHRGRDRMVA